MEVKVKVNQTIEAEISPLRAIETVRKNLKLWGCYIKNGLILHSTLSYGEVFVSDDEEQVAILQSLLILEAYLRGLEEKDKI